MKPLVQSNRHCFLLRGLRYKLFFILGTDHINWWKMPRQNKIKRIDIWSNSACQAIWFGHGYCRTGGKRQIQRLHCSYSTVALLSLKCIAMPGRFQICKSLQSHTTRPGELWAFRCQDTRLKVAALCTKVFLWSDCWIQRLTLTPLLVQCHFNSCLSSGRVSPSCCPTMGCIALSEDYNFCEKSKDKGGNYLTFPLSLHLGFSWSFAFFQHSGVNTVC